MWQSVKVLNVFNTLSKTNFQENENRFQKAGVPFFSWNH